jgi:hypothetical protein
MTVCGISWGGGGGRLERGMGIAEDKEKRKGKYKIKKNN